MLDDEERPGAGAPGERRRGAADVGDRVGDLHGTLQRRPAHHLKVASCRGIYGEITADEFVGIQRLVHRYADAVVHRDPDRWAATWADDAVWDLGRGRRVEGRTAIVDLWRSAMAGMHAVVQTVDNGDALAR